MMKKAPIAILCGGKGKRLKPKTLTIPKALIPIRGKPIIDYIIERYLTSGFNDFIICTGYKSKLIEDHCNNILNDSYSIHYKNSGLDASILRRLYAVRDHVRDNIIMSYGDTLTNIDLNKMMTCHQKSGALVTISSGKIKNPFGLVHYGNDGVLNSFSEKPVFNYYIGYAIFQRQAFDHISESLLNMADGTGLVAFYQELIKTNSIYVYEHEGFQITFNTEGELAAAEKQIELFYTVRED